MLLASNQVCTNANFVIQDEVRKDGKVDKLVDTSTAELGVWNIFSIVVFHERMHKVIVDFAHTVDINHRVRTEWRANPQGPNHRIERRQGMQWMISTMLYPVTIVGFHLDLETCSGGSSRAARRRGEDGVELALNSASNRRLVLIRMFGTNVLLARLMRNDCDLNCSYQRIC
jgi:hypothetical protein